MAMPPVLGQNLESKLSEIAVCAVGKCGLCGLKGRASKTKKDKALSVFVRQMDQLSPVSLRGRLGSVWE